MFPDAETIRKLILLFILVRCSALKELAEVFELSGEPDFHSVKLKWEYPKNGINFYGFQIHYCELQAWGPNRCRTKIIDESSGVESPAGKKYRMYAVLIKSLRMATNYSFEVRPMETRHNSQHTKPFGKSIIVPTKGSKANLCLPEVSEVEVSTGPYFGGRIAVESAPSEEECGVAGDANSSRDSYILRIEHKTCGSLVNRTTVSTFILVQETLPILTHSTRRFLVLCTFQPETLTVRAGINLPHTGYGASSGPTTTVASKSDITLYNEIAGNDIQAASLLQSSDNIGHARYKDGETDSHVLLVTVLLLSSIVAIVLTIWWMMPLKRSIGLATKRSSLSIFSCDSTSSLSAYENYANSMRDSISITDIDFGNIILEENCADGEYKNGVFNSALNDVFVDSKNNESIISMESSTQSEA